MINWAYPRRMMMRLSLMTTNKKIVIMMVTKIRKKRKVNLGNRTMMIMIRQRE